MSSGQTGATSRLNNQGGGRTAISRSTTGSTFSQTSFASLATQRACENMPQLLTSTVIDLDSICESSWDRTTIDISNNADSAGFYTCSVLNCEAVFSSEESLGHHMNMFQHSPCNPFLKMIDLKLLPDALCYLCPACDRQYPSAEQCQEHMNEFKHLTFLPPLEISSYICPQCLYLFESFGQCWDHMEKSSHYSIASNFSGRSYNQ